MTQLQSDTGTGFQAGLDQVEKEVVWCFRTMNGDEVFCTIDHRWQSTVSISNPMVLERFYELGIGYFQQMHRWEPWLATHTRIVLSRDDMVYFEKAADFITAYYWKALKKSEEIEDARMKESVDQATREMADSPQKDEENKKDIQERIALSNLANLTNTKN